MHIFKKVETAIKKAARTEQEGLEIAIDRNFIVLDKLVDGNYDWLIMIERNGNQAKATLRNERWDEQPWSIVSWNDMMNVVRSLSYSYRIPISLD